MLRPRQRLRRDGTKAGRSLPAGREFRHSLYVMFRRLDSNQNKRGQSPLGCQLPHAGFNRHYKLASVGRVRVHDTEHLLARATGCSPGTTLRRPLPTASAREYGVGPALDPLVQRGRA